jgi:hypothetical protein
MILFENRNKGIQNLMIKFEKPEFQRNILAA